MKMRPLTSKTLSFDCSIVSVCLSVCLSLGKPEVYFRWHKDASLSLCYCLSMYIYVCVCVYVWCCSCYNENFPCSQFAAVMEILSRTVYARFRYPFFSALIQATKDARSDASIDNLIVAEWRRERCLEWRNDRCRFRETNEMNGQAEEMDDWTGRDEWGNGKMNENKSDKSAFCLLPCSLAH